LILSMLDDNTVFNALRAGANGYILKGAGGEETLRAIRAVAGGESIFSPSIARRMMQHFDHSQNQASFPELTEREREILQLLAQGLTNSAIAERLSLSIKTVRNRVSDIFSKLHVHDRAEAILKAREAGLS
jgi:DNA-binding NarL/FixJ family response regulator